MPPTTARRPSAPTRRSAAVTLGVTALLAASLTGCSIGEEEPDQVAVCVDQETQERVADDQCDPEQESRGGSGSLVGAAFLWYYLGRASAFPALGARVAGGTFATPASGTWARGGVPSQGGTVKAGGFGSSSKSGGARSGFGG